MTTPTNRSLFRLPGRLGRYSEMASDVAWSGTADLLTMAAQTASFILLGRNLGTAGYGGYIGLYGIIGPIGALSWAGLSLLVMQQILRQRQPSNVVARTALTLALVQGVIAGILAYAIASQVISSVSTTAVVLLIIVDLLTTPVIMITAALRQAIVDFPAAARIRIGLVLIRVSILIGLTVVGELTIENLAFGWLIGLVLYVAVCLRLFWPRMGVDPGLTRPTREAMTTNVQLSLPLASSNLQRDGDKAVLNGYGFVADAGLYGAAFRIVTMAQLPIQTLNTALFHRFLSNDDRIKGQHVRRTARFSVVSLGLSLAIGAVIWVVAPLLTIVLGDEFAESVDIVRALLLYLPLIGLSRAPLNGLLGVGATGTRAVIVLTSAALAMVLYLTLIPSMSWEGAVIGTIVAEAFLGAAGWLALIRAERRFDAMAGQRIGAGTTEDDDQPSDDQPATVRAEP